MNIETLVGRKVVAQIVPGAEAFNGAIAIVTNAGTVGSSTVLRGEFKSPQKPDDTVSFTFQDFRVLPTVGDRVTYTGTAMEHLSGRVGTVSIDDGSEMPLFIRGLYADNADRGIWATYGDATLLEDEAPSQVETVTKADYERLQQELDRANERVEELRVRAGKWERDFDRLANAVMNEAERRDWCSDFEDFEDRVDEELEIGVMPRREREWDVEVNVEGTLRISTTVSVTASSQEAANEMVNENMDEYVNADELLTDKARHVSFEDIECEVEEG